MSNNDQPTFTLPNNIRIPEKEISTFASNSGSRMKDREVREALIKEYVIANKDKIITINDLGMAVYGKTGHTYVGVLIKSLIRRGRLTRTKVKNGRRGASYTYVWHNQRVVDPARSNGPVTVRVPEGSMKLPTAGELDRLIWEFIKDKKVDSVDQLREFSIWVQTKLRKE